MKKIDIRKNLINSHSKISILCILLVFIIFLQSCKTNTSTIKKEGNIAVDIAVVDLEKIKDSKTYQNLQKKINELKDDVEKKLKDKKDSKELQNLEYFLKINFEEKKQQYYNDFLNKLNKAIYYTSNKEKIGLVVSYQSMPYGGIDITEKVIYNLDNNNFDNFNQFNTTKIISYIDTENIKENVNLLPIIQKINPSKEIYVVLNKKEVFLGGFDLNEELPKSYKKDTSTKDKKNTK